MSSPAIAAEKVQQAVDLLGELEIDLWLTFVRETMETGDPVLPLILDHQLTWQSALMLTRTGKRLAIVGKYEDSAVRSTGVWTDVVPYIEGIRQPLREALGRFDPKRIAINYSVDDVKADGLSHGMYLVLREHLAGTPYIDRLESASELIQRLRGRKSPGEVQRIRTAIETTAAIFDAVGDYARPGMTEQELASYMHHQVERLELEFAWEQEMCPIVTTGPESMIGHGLPSTSLAIRPGNILHVDFGVREDEYCCDVQRCWYVPRSGEDAPPDAVTRAFDTVVRAIEAAAAVLRPGQTCWCVDAAARRVVTEAGYPEYQHATGHQVGRAAHDGGGVLGPRWERYGETPNYTVEAGNVFTLELGIEDVDGRGSLSLEEMVLVTDDGVEWLTEPQVSLPLLGQS